MSQYNFTSIGTVHSCYKEKFGIPRQPGLVASPATIEIDATYSQDEAFRELEMFSHIWVIFVFHEIADKNWKPTVRPPRLGGNQRTGVFASRSMFRPNSIGLSVVELESVERKNNKIVLNIIGGDFLELTPVLDIKPYIPYADSISTSKAGYATARPEVKFIIVYTAEAKAEIKKAEEKYPDFESIITEILQLDPRPAYHDKKHIKNTFAIKLYDYDLKWHIENEQIIVTALTIAD